MNIIINLWFIIIFLMLVAGIVLRLVPRKLPPVQMHKVSPSAASRLVSDFIASSYETDFGYPSGYFRVETATDSQVVAKEWVTKGSHFVQIIRGFYRAIFALGAPFGCFGMFMTAGFAMFATPALLYAALTETILKYLLRSRVTAEIERARDGVTVTFTLRGPSALLVGRRLERAFSQPALPARVAALAGVAVPQPGTGPSAAPAGAAA